jgi:hypothetical protein
MVIIITDIKTAKIAITIKSSIKVKEGWSLDFEEKNLKNIKKKLGFLRVKNEK